MVRNWLIKSECVENGPVRNENGKKEKENISGYDARKNEHGSNGEPRHKKDFCHVHKIYGSGEKYHMVFVVIINIGLIRGKLFGWKSLCHVKETQCH